VIDWIMSARWPASPTSDLASEGAGGLDPVRASSVSGLRMEVVLRGQTAGKVGPDRPKPSPTRRAPNFKAPVFGCIFETCSDCSRVSTSGMDQIMFEEPITARGLDVGRTDRAREAAHRGRARTRRRRWEGPARGTRFAAPGLDRGTASPSDGGGAAGRSVMAKGVRWMTAVA